MGIIRYLLKWLIPAFWKVPLWRGTSYGRRPGPLRISPPHGDKKPASKGMKNGIHGD